MPFAFNQLINMKFWQGKTVLLTGHTGFKGSWLSLWLQSLGVNLIGYSLAPAASPNLFEISQLQKGMVNILNDIRDYVSLHAVIQKYQPEIIIHMAAQSLVRHSYQAPLETYAINIMGTINLLEAARLAESVKVIVNVTSDKCYENSELNKKFIEEDRLGGYDPYSNSKACSELITQTYRHVYFKERGVGVATARAGNVIGGGDWAKDRLVPDVLTACMKQEDILLRYPDALRPWQHVLQPLYGYLILAERLFSSPENYSESWNFGPDLEDIKSVSWVTDYLIKTSNSSIKWIKDENKHLYEASTLQLDCTKAKKSLDWTSIWNLEIGLKKTIAWFSDYQNGENMHEKTLSQINQFSNDCRILQKKSLRKHCMVKEFIHVPYGKSVHGEEEIDAVVSVLRCSTQMGPAVREMEKKISELFSKKFGIMLNSGSSANYLAVELLELPEFSEVITPALTFSTTVAPLIKNKLIPVFIDVELDTFNIDVDRIESMISSKTKALMIPNLLGNLPDWKKIRIIADKYNLVVIEDSCDTLGATFLGSASGFYSDVSTTSFYGSHIINCAGNGGMLCVNNPEIAQKAMLLRSWGRSSSLYVESESILARFQKKIGKIDYDAKFVFEEIGYNLEPSELGAAFGLVQLAKLSKNIEKRKKVFASHLNFFSVYNDWFIFPKQLPAVQTAWLAFPLIVKDDAPFNRKDLQIYLENRNIQTRTIFTGNILRQPGFEKILRREVDAGYAHADQIMRGGILMGSHHGMTDAMVNHIYESFKEFEKSYTSIYI